MRLFIPFFLILVLVLSFFCASSSSAAGNIQERAIGGLKNNDIEGGVLPKDLWAGLSIDQAIELSESLSLDFTSRVYRDLYRNLLLAKSDGFYIKTADDDQYSKADISSEQAVKWLDIRFTHLLKLGAFAEYKALYKEIYNKDQPEAPQLALHAIHILFLEMKMSEACLDINIYAQNFPEFSLFNDLKHFCDSQLNQSDDVSGETSDTAQSILKNIAALNLEAFLNASMTEKLAVFAAGLMPVSPSDRIESLSPFDLKLQIMNAEKDEQKLCLAEQAFKTYALDHDALRVQYKSLDFDHDLSDDDAIVKRHQLSPCIIPAWFYQWIEAAPNAEAEASRSLIALRALMEEQRFLIPVFVSLFIDHLDVSELTDEERWVLGGYIVQSDEDFPRLWRNSAVEKNPDGSLKAIRSDWYWQILLNSDEFSSNHYNFWVENFYIHNKKNVKKEYSKPLTLLKTTLNMVKYKETIKDHYEKFFPLTFSRNYVIFDTGLIWNIETFIENRYAGKSLLLLLHISGNLETADTYIGYLSLLMDMFDQIGYKKYGRDLIVDTLSVGKN